MDLRALDRYLTSGPEWEPTVITQGRYHDWHDSLCVNERKCDKCESAVGWNDYVSIYNKFGVDFTDYLRLDEDDEINRCEACVNVDDWNESVR